MAKHFGSEALAMITLNLNLKPMTGLGGGFRSEWVSAESETLETGIDSGGGLGSPYVTFWIKREGDEKRQYYIADMRDVLTSFIEKAPTKPT